MRWRIVLGQLKGSISNIDPGICHNFLSLFGLFCVCVHARGAGFGQRRSIGHVPLTSTHAGTYTRKAGNQDICRGGSPRCWQHVTGWGPQTSAQDAIEHTLDGWGDHPSHVLLPGQSPCVKRLSQKVPEKKNNGSERCPSEPNLLSLRKPGTEIGAQLYYFVNSKRCLRCQANLLDLPDTGYL